MNGYPTGVSDKPINIAQGGLLFAQAAIDNRLNEIEQNKEYIDEAHKRLLKSFSTKAAPELGRALQQKYSKEIENARQEAINRFVQKGEKISEQELMEIENKFSDIQSRELVDIQTMKELENVRQTILDPRNEQFYDIPKAMNTYQKMYDEFQSGKAVGSPSALLVSNRLPVNLVDYAFKRYADEIKGIDIEASGTFDGNVFKMSQGAEPNELNNVVRRIMRDQVAAGKYTKNGVVDEEAYRTEANALIQAIARNQQETRPYRQTTGGSGRGTEYEPYVNKDPYETQVGKKITTANSSVSLTDIPAFVYNNKKVAAESIETLPTANNRDAYIQAAVKYYLKRGIKKESAQELANKDVAKNLIIDKEILPFMEDGSYSVVPYVKIQYPEKGGVDFETLEGLLNKGTKTVVDYVPYSNQNIKNALGGKLGKKREPVFRVTEQLKGTNQQSAKPTGKPPLSVSAYNKAKGKNYTRAQIESYFGKDYTITD